MKKRTGFVSLQGFTLIEMSIVLVIIGVLTGGVLLGRSLIRTSELQAVITDTDNYIAAMGNFKKAYQSLPGDMPNAHLYWGTDSLGCNTGGGATGTCDGNADGKIGGVTSQEYEVFRFWQQLYDAGMFTQQLSGAASGGVYNAVIGTNVPAGKIAGSGFTPVWLGAITGSSTGFCTSGDCFQGVYGNVLQFGGKIAASTSITYGPVLTTEQAAGIDAKIDDGMPGTGKVRAYASTSTLNPGCTNSTAYATAAYQVGTSGILCSLIFVTGF